MTKRILATLALLITAVCPAQESERPDVLFIAIDDLNDWVGVLGGHPQARTPNIDALAARGMLFTNAHTVGTSCNPARTSIMTGLQPATTGVYDNLADWRVVEKLQGVPTLPRHFRDEGYRTFGSGKLFHAHTYYSEGFYGFNDPTAWDAFYPSVDRQLPDEVGPAVRPANGNPGYLGFDWSAIVTDDRAMADGQVTAWMERRLEVESEDPEFLAVGIYRPHLPWYVPQAYLDMHPLEDIQLPPTLETDLDDVPAIAHPAAMSADETHDWLLEHALWEEAVRAYLASTSFADAMVGRLIEALDRSGRADNTIIVLWSDHGFHLGEKHRWRKWTLWEEVTHVPLIIAAPGVTTPGTRTAKPVSLLDLFPTLTELTGIETPGYLEGNSLVPLLKEPDADWEHAAVTNNGYLEHAVRDTRYRYIHHSDGSEELYDLKEDPHEWTNLATNPDLADVKQALARRLPQVHAIAE